MGSFQEMFDKMVAHAAGWNPGQDQPAPPATPRVAELPPVDPAVPSAHVCYAFSPRQGPWTTGGYHLVLDQPLRAARLEREQDDALCKPQAKFWGLERGNPRQQPTCPTCLERAVRYGITVRTPS